MRITGVLAALSAVADRRHKARKRTIFIVVKVKRVLIPQDQNAFCCLAVVVKK